MFSNINRVSVDWNANHVPYTLEINSLHTFLLTAALFSNTEESPEVRTVVTCGEGCDLIR